MTTYPQMQYYRSAVFLQRIANHKKMDIKEAEMWMKIEYFGGSTRIWTPLEFEEIASSIRSDFSKQGVWIPQPNEEDLPPNFQEGYERENFPHEGDYQDQCLPDREDSNGEAHSLRGEEEALKASGGAELYHSDAYWAWDNSDPVVNNAEGAYSMEEQGEENYP